MMTLTIEVDRQTEQGLRRLSAQDGGDMTHCAARLLAHAVRAARPRPVFDPTAIQAANAAFVAEDQALAESARVERADLLTEEDAA
ncbi:MAG TPA: hypothetical protein VGM03_04500 [Phycisphaerae bacterium]